MNAAANSAIRKEPAWSLGRLSATPEAPSAPREGAGLRWLDLSLGRNPALFVPAGLPANRPVPLVILLHGAGGNALGTLPLMQDLAEKRKFLLLAPQSQGPTWDVISSDFGSDVGMLDRALKEVFEYYRVDGTRIAIAGFSDGASYALSIGLTNGRLFSDILAFSPGFMAPFALSGRPRIFISHGRHDTVLPIERCSRRIVAQLAAQGFAVDYREFDDDHIAPYDMIVAGLDRFLSGRSD